MLWNFSYPSPEGFPGSALAAPVEVGEHRVQGGCPSASIKVLEGKGVKPDEFNLRRVLAELADAFEHCVKQQSPSSSIQSPLVTLELVRHFGGIQNVELVVHHRKLDRGGSKIDG